MAKVYAVRVGRKTGLFNTWSECEEQVKHFSGAKYKSFSTKEEAEAYLTGTEIKQEEFDQNIIIAYVDGSFNPSTNECGYASFLIHGDKRKILCGRFIMTDSGRNVEGEVKAVYETLKYLKVKQYKNIVIYHDYEGIGNWADKVWQANKVYTQEYTNFVNALRNQGFQIMYKHVYGHANVKENEYADKIAKLACGVSITASDDNLLMPIKSINGFPSQLPYLSQISWSDYKNM